MQRIQDVVLVAALSFLLLALVSSAPVNTDVVGDTKEKVQETVKDTSPEDELKSLPLKIESADDKVPSLPELEEEPAAVVEPENAADSHEEIFADDDDSSLPLVPGSELLEQAQQQQQGDGDFLPIETDDTQFGPADSLPALDLSPKTVAEYLVLTGDWQSFEQATSDLMAAGVLTPIEIEQYRDDVAYEYENLVREVAEAEAAYQEDTVEPYETYEEPMESLRQMAPNMAAQQLPLDTMDAPYFDMTEELRRLELDELLEREAALDELLRAIVEEYVNRAQEEEEQQQALQNELNNAQYVQVLDLVADAVEGEIATDDEAPKQQEEMANEVPEIENVKSEPSKEVEVQLESLAHNQLPQQVENEALPVKTEVKDETADSQKKISEDTSA